MLTSLHVYWGRDDKRPAAKMTSLSIDGCLIETRRQAGVGRLVSFEIGLPTGSRLPLEGRVIYRRDPVGFAVLFARLSAGQRDSLIQIIERARPFCSLPDS